MATLTFIYDYWKEFAIAALVALLLWFGYHVKGLEDKSNENDALRKANVKLATTIAKITDFNQKLDKSVVPDDKACLNKPLHTDTLKLLY